MNRKQRFYIKRLRQLTKAATTPPEDDFSDLPPLPEYKPKTPAPESASPDDVFYERLQPKEHSRKQPTAPPETPAKQPVAKPAKEPTREDHELAANIRLAEEMGGTASWAIRRKQRSAAFKNTAGFGEGVRQEIENGTIREGRGMRMPYTQINLSTSKHQGTVPGSQVGDISFYQRGSKTPYAILDRVHVREGLESIEAYENLIRRAWAAAVNQSMKLKIWSMDVLVLTTDAEYDYLNVLRDKLLEEGYLSEDGFLDFSRDYYTDAKQ